MNARFWVYHNGAFAKLTVRPNEEVSLHSGGRTDEGYSYSSETYHNDGDGIILYWGERSLDCDGRMDRSGTSACPLALLRSREVEGVDVLLPEWERGERSQRDYSAEAAGY